LAGFFAAVFAIVFASPGLVATIIKIGLIQPNTGAIRLGIKKKPSNGRQKPL